MFTAENSSVALTTFWFAYFVYCTEGENASLSLLPLSTTIRGYWEKNTHTYTCCALQKSSANEKRVGKFISRRAFTHWINCFFIHGHFFRCCWRRRRRRHFNQGWFTFLQESISFFFCLEAFDSSCVVLFIGQMVEKFVSNKTLYQRNAIHFCSFACSLTPQEDHFWIEVVSEHTAKRMNNRKKWELLPTSKFGTQNVCIFHSVLRMFSAGEREWASIAKQRSKTRQRTR